MSSEQPKLSHKLTPHPRSVLFLLKPIGGGCPVFEGHPKLAAWYHRVEAAVGKELFREANEVILKAKDSPPANPIIKQKLMSRVLTMIQ